MAVLSIAALNLFPGITYTHPGWGEVTDICDTAAGLEEHIANLAANGIGPVEKVTVWKEEDGDGITVECETCHQGGPGIAQAAEGDLLCPSCATARTARTRA